jgi:O-succinylbenzoic acid--CoA ligase
VTAAVTLVSAAYHRASIALDGRGAARGARERTSAIFELTTAGGARGRGEAAPLPGLSPDTLEAAEADLAAVAAALATAPVTLAATPPERDRAAPWPELEALTARAASPAARFAIEVAAWDAIAAARGTSLAAVVGEAARGLAGASPLAPSIVVDTPDEAAAAADRGPALKIKVGGAAAAGVDGVAAVAADCARVRAIARAAPGARLRLDANRGWPRAAVADALRSLADLPIDYIEEPCADAVELLSGAGGLAIPIALDESLAQLAPGALAAALASPLLGALVLKPTLLGARRALALAAQARRAGVPVVVTHCLEGPIGRAACAALAGALAAPPSPPAVLTRDAAWTFAELATLAASADPPGPARDAGARPPRSPAAGARAARCVIATPEAATVAAVHAALAAREPIALLHHRLPAPELARQRAAVEAAALPADAAVVLFTSGSTGAARGVVLGRRAIDAAAAASAQHLGWRTGDRWLLALSLAHAGGLAIAARCLGAARAVVIAPDPAELADQLARATLASLVPTQLAALLALPGWRPPAHLRAILLGGAAAPPALLRAAAERGAPVLPTYGMTETFGQIATAPLDRAGDPAAPLVPLAGVELAAGTPEAPAPIRVRGPLLATQYLDGAAIAPELITADLGFLADGALVVVGRADDVIVTAGAKVHPQQVEALLAATPGVRAACAFAIPDERWGQIVGAAIAVTAAFDPAAARARWHAGLPPAARPRRLAVVAELPVSANGKLDRRAAAALPRAPVDYGDVRPART